MLERTVRGQYGPGRLPDGTNVPGYRNEGGVDPQSAIETFVAMKFHIDNWRWAGVPFYLRTGKRMPDRRTELVVQFRVVPYMLFRETPVDHLTPNQLVVRIQPREGIHLRFGAKVPGPVPALTAWRAILFLVQGRDKASALQRVLRGDPRLPATRVREEAAHVDWLVEEEAAGALDGDAYVDLSG